MSSSGSILTGGGSTTNETNMAGQIPLEELYLTALQFYREKSGKAIHISYNDNLKLVALAKQIANGRFDAEKAPQLGVLDVIGKDRRYAWEKLGNMGKPQAMEDFVKLLGNLCPSFKPYVEAIECNRRNRDILKVGKCNVDADSKSTNDKSKEESTQEEEETRNKEDAHLRSLQDMLNQQTYQQFKAYASRQFPGNPEQQALLIRQLQHEHYHQYMQQLHAKSDIFNMESTNEASETCNENECCNSLEVDDANQENENVQSANMWTRPDIKVFKKDVSSGKGEGVIRVEHGETVTVRIPTHEAGNSIFWEFATDDFDIGFGVYFEWKKSVTNEVTVSISESDDDEDLYEDENDDDENEFAATNDLEGGPNYHTRFSDLRPPISIIVPVYRRECQNEVYCGCHTYPSEGVYLLKFDNSFSIWRSKTLYYRVYYEKPV